MAPSPFGKLKQAFGASSSSSAATYDAHPLPRDPGRIMNAPLTSIARRKQHNHNQNHNHPPLNNNTTDHTHAASSNSRGSCTPSSSLIPVSDRASLGEDATATTTTSCSTGSTNQQQQEQQQQQQHQQHLQEETSTPRRRINTGTAKNIKQRSPVTPKQQWKQDSVLSLPGAHSMIYDNNDNNNNPNNHNHNSNNNWGAAGEASSASISSPSTVALLRNRRRTRNESSHVAAAVTTPNNKNTAEEEEQDATTSVTKISPSPPTKRNIRHKPDVSLQRLQSDADDIHEHDDDESNNSYASFNQDDNGTMLRARKDTATDNNPQHDDESYNVGRPSATATANVTIAGNDSYEEDNQEQDDVKNYPDSRIPYRSSLTSTRKPRRGLSRNKEHINNPKKMIEPNHHSSSSHHRQSMPTNLLLETQGKDAYVKHTRGALVNDGREMYDEEEDDEEEDSKRMYRSCSQMMDIDLTNGGNVPQSPSFARTPLSNTNIDDQQPQGLQESDSGMLGSPSQHEYEYGRSPLPASTGSQHNQRQQRPGLSQARWESSKMMLSPSLSQHGGMSPLSASSQRQQQSSSRRGLKGRREESAMLLSSPQSQHKVSPLSSGSSRHHQSHHQRPRLQGRREDSAIMWSPSQPPQPQPKPQQKGGLLSSMLPPAPLVTGTAAMRSGSPGLSSQRNLVPRATTAGLSQRNLDNSFHRQAGGGLSTPRTPTAATAQQASSSPIPGRGLLERTTQAGLSRRNLEKSTLAGLSRRNLDRTPQAGLGLSQPPSPDVGTAPLDRDPRQQLSHQQHESDVSVPTEEDDWRAVYHRQVQELERKDMEIAMRLNQQENNSLSLGAAADDDDLEYVNTGNGRDGNTEQHPNEEEIMLQLAMEMSRAELMDYDDGDEFAFDDDDNGDDDDRGGYPSRRAALHQEEEDEDEALQRALRLSQQTLPPPPVRTEEEEEEELQRVLKLSEQQQWQQQQHNHDLSLPDLRPTEHDGSDDDVEEEEEEEQLQLLDDEYESLQRAIQLSKQQEQMEQRMREERRKAAAEEEEDEELLRALRISQEEMKEQENEQRFLDQVLKCSQEDNSSDQRM